MSIKDALQRKNLITKLSDGTEFTLMRPSVLDLVDAIEFSKSNPTQFHAWLVLRHLVENGSPVFSTLEEVLALDAIFVSEIAVAAEKLYGEGRD